MLQRISYSMNPPRPTHGICFIISVSVFFSISSYILLFFNLLMFFICYTIIIIFIIIIIITIIIPCNAFCVCLKTNDLVIFFSL